MALGAGLARALGARPSGGLGIFLGRGGARQRKADVICVKWVRGRLRILGSMSAPPPHAPEKRSELRAFLFLTVVMAPVLAGAIVGIYGLMVWIYQLFAGPPSA